MTIDQSDFKPIFPPIPTFEGKVICISGIPAEGPKKEICDRLRAVGANCSENCTQSVDFLVRCDKIRDNGQLMPLDYVSGKQEQARQYGIRELSESEFMEILRKDEQRRSN